MKNKKIIIILCVVLAVLIAGFAAVWHFSKKNATPSDSDMKEITLIIVDDKSESKDYTILTKSETLGDLLFEQRFISEDEYKAGFFLTVKGITADFNENEAWWCITKDGEMTTVGANEQIIKDGDKFEITYTIG